MHQKTNTIIVVAALAGLASSVGLAAEVNPSIVVRADGPRIVTYRRLIVNETLPQLGARIYDRVDYELKLQKLSNDIKRTQAQLEYQRERANIYNKHLGRKSALIVTRQNAQLAVIDSELRLRELRKEKQLAVRHRADQVRYRQLILAQGAARLNVEQ